MKRRDCSTKYLYNYCENNSTDMQDLSKTVLDIVQSKSWGLCDLLRQFLFKGYLVEKQVDNFSGGEKEKAMLSLCCMMLELVNLLILDEHTNHFDICSKEMIQESLQCFQCTVIVTSSVE